MRVDTPYETQWVDTGFIVFNDRNYPRFERLWDAPEAVTELLQRGSSG